MIDRERAIKAAMAANGSCSSEWRISAERIVDAVLALPVVIDDAMVERAFGAFSATISDAGIPRRPTYVERDAMRAALEAALKPPEAQPSTYEPTRGRPRYEAAETSVLAAVGALEASRQRHGLDGLPVDAIRIREKSGVSYDRANAALTRLVKNGRLLKPRRGYYLLPADSPYKPREGRS